MQELRFGRIENLHVRGGEPLFDPPPRLVQKIKIDSAGPLRAPRADCALKARVIGCLDQLTRIQNGVVQSIEVRDGLPFTIEVETKPRP
jgi:hypothetical protein